MYLSEHERLAGQALREKYDQMSHGGSEPHGHHVVLRLLETVADIERRKAIQLEIDNRVGRPVAAKPSWHRQVVRDLDERDEAARQRRKDIDEGADPRRLLGLW